MKDLYIFRKKNGKQLEKQQENQSEKQNQHYIQQSNLNAPQQEVPQLKPNFPLPSIASRQSIIFSIALIRKINFYDKESFTFVKSLPFQQQNLVEGQSLNKKAPILKILTLDLKESQFQQRNQRQNFNTFILMKRNDQ
ncbi:unnamed protein product [Paramecium primaurelia]|uniref:Uncharacterized protein n=1 Tax=Paramecium primaurelia TaxID=5886 RepID=A0A8S1LVT5_PARPR|nr:unnamed protein product [Paramecium primaurelia]